jgi:perosamine synthetase
LRNLGFEPEGRRFIHHEMGWNYRLTNLQAAVGLAQLEQIEASIEKKRFMGKYYMEHLSFLISHGFQLPLDSTGYAENIYWIFGMLASSEIMMTRLIDRLSKHQVGTRPFFWCMHEQPVFRKLGLFENQKFPVAENMARKGFYIPSGLGMDKKDLGFVTKTISDFINGN